MISKDSRFKSFLARPGQNIDLKKFATQVPKLYISEREAEALLEEEQEKLGELQARLYAEARQSLLVIIQGMDTAGKDGLIKNVMNGINPQGVVIHSFKKPSHLELSHDFLWRSQMALPPRGYIGIFNRSYYEDVTIARVHPQILADQNLPLRGSRSNELWQNRFSDIVNYEAYLSRQGWRIVKLFLHISRNEQRNRLIARIDDPNKHWKFDPNDINERRHWSRYQKYYAECFSKTSTNVSPWWILPADDKKNTRLIASRIIVSNLIDMNPRYPKAGPAQARRIRAAARILSRT